jgi:hypothetical protein
MKQLFRLSFHLRGTLHHLPLRLHQLQRALLRPRPPSASHHAVSDATCVKLGEFAHALALLRDRGQPASEYLALVSDAAIKTGGAEGAYWERISRDIILTVYKNTWWTPTMARQKIELECFQRYK